MSQHDYDLANASGASFRSDLNNALAAIKTLNSGATAPSSTAAFMLWADTANNLLKIRNAADSAWVSIGTLSATNLGLLALTGGTLTGALQIAVGTVGAPGLSFDSDANTGVYSSAADILGLVAAGTEYLRISSAGGNFLGTGSVKVPVGTTAQRPGSPADGHLRYNSDNAAYEGYVTSAWQSLAVGSILPIITSVTTTYTTVTTDDIVYCSSPGAQYAITLHTPTTNKRLIIARTDNDLTKTISITGTITGKDGVDATNFALHTAGEHYIIQYNTALSKWRLLDHITNTELSATSTITLTASTSGSFTFGTTTAKTVAWYRRGRHAVVQIDIRQTGAGSNGTGNALITLPNSLTADTTAGGPAYTGTDPSVAITSRITGQIYGGNSGGAGNIIARAYLYDSTKIGIVGLMGGSLGIWGSSLIGLANAVTNINGEVWIPISGWKD